LSDVGHEVPTSPLSSFLTATLGVPCGLKGALIPIVALTRGFPLAPFGWSGTPRRFPMDG
jgi:hypothetical protein